jgi:hypothetical protein
MAKLTVRSGAATRSEYIFINDSASTTGAGLTGLVFNSASLTAYYVTERGTPTPITLVTLASATAAYSSGGFVAVDGTNLPGVYRLDVPAAVFATTKGVVMLKGAANMVPVLLEYDVVAYDPTDTVRLGLTAVPNVSQGTTGAISTGNATGQVTVATNNDKTGYSLTQTFPTNFASMAITVGGAVTAGTVSDKTGYSLTQTFPTNFASMAITAGGAVTAGTVSDKTGYSLATSQTFSTTGSVGSVTGAVGSVTGAVGSVTGAVGTVTGAVGSVTSAVTVGTNNDKTGYSLGASQTFSTTGSVGSVTGAVGSVTGAITLAGSQTFSTTGSVGSVAGAVGSVTGAVGSVTGAVTVGTNNDKANYALSSANQTAIAGLTWDQLRSGHAMTGSFGEYVNITGSSPGGSATLVRMGPFEVRADGLGASDPLDIQKGAQHGIDIQCVDNNGSGIDITSATVTAKVYNSGATLVDTYSCTATYAADGRAQFTIDTTVTNTPGTYTATITRTTGASDTQVFGPLRIYVRDI